MSVSSLERNAKLRPGTVTNIIHKRLTNPKIEILVQIAEVLDCSLYDLINIKQKQSFIRKMHESSLPYSWDANLYLSAVTLAEKYFTKYGLKTSLGPSLEIIFEIYIYSVKNNQSQIDDNFADWIIEKYSKTL